MAACLCLIGCTVGPDYHPPEMRVPANFVAGQPRGRSQSDEKKPNQDHNEQIIEAEKWWQALHDTELNSLIDRAIQNNLDLEIALDRIQEARTQEDVVLGISLPEAGLSAGGGQGSGSDLARGRVSEALISAEHTGGKLQRVMYIGGFDAGWELDLFGKFRREMEAAAYDTQAAIAARNAVLISVIADVAHAYIDLRALQMQSAALQKNIGVAKQYVYVTQERFNRGITNELDVALAQRQLSTLQAQQLPLIAQTHAAQYVIAVLLGKFPEDMAKELEKSEMIPALPGNVDAGLPLDLLRRRPDIHEAERSLAGATARIGVATADLFPQVALVGGAGYQGQGLGVNPTIAQSIWSIGPSVNWSLLDFGTLDALVDIVDLRTRETLVNYKETVLNAVREVDTSIDSYKAQQDQLRNLGEALVASQLAVSLATQRYDRGLIDALNVIDAERQEYDLEEQYIEAQKTQAEQFTALYKALGGGWEQYQNFPPIRQPRPAILAAFSRLLNSNNP
jgi:NodT family efflux transporter outer membrane factor (OMF) lipoprotein